jgi:hypothetical protein
MFAGQWNRIKLQKKFPVYENNIEYITADCGTKIP